MADRCVRSVLLVPLLCACCLLCRLNVMKLSKASIVANFPVEKMNKRIRRWFMLGLSLGRLLELSEGATLVRALCQLIEEYEHFIAAKKDVIGSKGGDSGSSLVSSGDAAAQGQLAPFLLLGAAHGSMHVAAVVAVAAQAAAAAAAAAAGHSNPSTSSSKDGDSASSSSSAARDAAARDLGAIKPALHKVAKIGVVYDYLQPHATCVPEQLDYCEIVQSLCDLFNLLYTKLLHPGCAPPLVHEAILRVDRKIKTLVLAKINGDLVGEVVNPMLKQEVSAMLNRSFWDEKSSSAAAATGGLGPKLFMQLDAEGAFNNLREDDDDEEDAK